MSEARGARLTFAGRVFVAGLVGLLVLLGWGVREGYRAWQAPDGPEAVTDRALADVANPSGTKPTRERASRSENSAETRVPAETSTEAPTNAPAVKAVPVLAKSDAAAPRARALPAVSAAPPISRNSSGAAGPAAGPAFDAPFDPPLSRARFDAARERAADFDPAGPPRLVEWVESAGRVGSVNPSSKALRVEYSLNEELTEDVFKVLRRGRVNRGHAIVIDPRNGRVLAYVSTDQESFPPERAYPAASIVKVLTAAALLEEKSKGVDLSCVYRGNKYRLNRRRLARPKSGRESSLEDAIATSNNQCFSQWALDIVGETRLHATFKHFGWLDSPARGHQPGRMEMVETKLDLGRMGSGLDGVRVTPLHVASLTSVLTHGKLIEPWWIDRVVDAEGQSLSLPPRDAPRRVLTPARARKLRSMMVSTTKRGTAKSAFRTRRGRPLLGEIDVAGKTGNLSGRDPVGRYEWFMGLAPASDPRIGVVVLQLQDHLWWQKSSELAANIFREVFCDRSGCRAARADALTGDLGPIIAPLRLSDLERRRSVAASGLGVSASLNDPINASSDGDSVVSSAIAR